jgi:hypothetical protein
MDDGPDPLEPDRDYPFTLSVAIFFRFVPQAGELFVG